MNSKMTFFDKTQELFPDDKRAPGLIGFICDTIKAPLANYEAESKTGENLLMRIEIYRQSPGKDIPQYFYGEAHANMPLRPAHARLHPDSQTWTTVTAPVCGGEKSGRYKFMVHILLNMGSNKERSSEILSTAKTSLSTLF